MNGIRDSYEEIRTGTKKNILTATQRMHQKRSLQLVAFWSIVQSPEFLIFVAFLHCVLSSEFSKSISAAFSAQFN